ncbi:spermatogenesis- and oogenesis-specific basic helix-loop-helix-containing protein 2-like isoform X2 [Ruditapes philippinarum]|uniref:spermatogenesis- and oogenesis-specific basic helix-loop-helix-containing protein 2-like isoform X2 n=1 Tax=Ruditapes philippinarum TaxID=129788 RepID=UPI00295A8FFD|nr:spermatogenesis- and oogenesis-specific basic helix-loop-helix-containing protein 2-like isoform X2 [Ruditapes philippinarum]
MEDVYEECFSYDAKTREDENDSPSKPATPHTPCTPGSDLDRSGFSISMDSGIGSPSLFSMQGDSSHKVIDIRTLKQNCSKRNSAKRPSKASSEHTSNEKHRRERIKDSCDQLRVLLPYIRGRKTDMASILEMAVDYLKIVNLCMPQSLHDQIVDILGKDPTLVPNKESSFKTRKGTTKSSAKSSAYFSTAQQCGSLAELIEKTSGSKKRSSKELNLSEIANSCDILGNNSSKHIRLQPNNSSNHSPESFHLDARLEPTLAGHTDVVPTYNSQSYSKSMILGEEKTFSGIHSSSSYNDGYNAAQQMFNTYNANKSSLLDSTTFRSTYSTDSTLYQYYPSLVANTPPQSCIYSTSNELVSSNNYLTTLPYTTANTKLENTTLLPENASKEC